LKLSSNQDGLGQKFQEEVEREAQQFLVTTLEKVITGFETLQFKRSSDAKEGQIFQEKLLAALSQDFQPAAPELRRQLSAELQEEVHPQLQRLRDPLRSAVRQSTGQLSQAVDDAMREAAASMADDKARQAAMRLNSCVATLEHEAHVEELAKVARSVLLPLASSDPSRNKAGKSGLAEDFLARIQAQLLPLKDSLDQLACEVGKVRSSLQGSSREPATASKEEATGREELLKLLKEGRFEEACCMACEQDLAAPQAPDAESLAEWTCDKVLAMQDKESATPDVFLSKEPKALTSPQMQLLLMKALMQPARCRVSKLDRLERNLEWAMSLAHDLHFNPAALSSFQEVISDILQGKGSMSTAGSTPAGRRVKSSARMAMKQLEVLQQTAQSCEGVKFQ